MKERGIYMSEILKENEDVVNEQATEETVREIEYLLRCASCECGW